MLPTPYIIKTLGGIQFNLSGPSSSIDLQTAYNNGNLITASQPVTISSNLVISDDDYMFRVHDSNNLTRAGIFGNGFLLVSSVEIECETPSLTFKDTTVGNLSCSIIFKDNVNV